MKIYVKKTSDEMRESIKKEVSDFINSGHRNPMLAVIQVGSDFASSKYVKNKEMACTEVLIETETYNVNETADTNDLLNLVKYLNQDENVDGILVQLPLPAHIDKNSVISAISPEKDVDGFTPENVANLWLGKRGVRPCTPSGIIKILDSINFNYDGAKAVVIGRSQIVGLPVAKMLLDRNCTVEICHSKTRFLYDKLRNADVIVTSAGKEGLINLISLEPRLVSNPVIIDVSINRGKDGKVCGDVSKLLYDDPDIYITPVPGGVGPMTITMLLSNTLDLYKKHIKNEKK